MPSGRNGEHPQASSFRSRRVYRANGRWFFDSREGPQFGPFRNEDEAIRALAVFLAQHADAPPADGSVPTDPPGAQDGIAHLVQEVVDMLHCHRDYGPLAACTWALSRLDDLERGRTKDRHARECIGVLRFALDHADQTFDFGVFLEQRARPSVAKTS